MNLRLVKGAYWDTEIKLAQEKGLDNYPVFTKKMAMVLHRFHPCLLKSRIGLFYYFGWILAHFANRKEV